MTHPFGEPPVFEQVAGELLLSRAAFGPPGELETRRSDQPEREPAEPVEDWSAGGDLDPFAEDHTDPEITDRDDPNYVEPWWPE